MQGNLGIGPLDPEPLSLRTNYLQRISIDFVMRMDRMEHAARTVSNSSTRYLNGAQPIKEGHVLLVWGIMPLRDQLCGETKIGTRAGMRV
jgi:hypothetical protein